VLRFVRVVLPLMGEVTALLAAVDALIARWPDDVDGELLVPTRALSASEHVLLQSLEGNVRVLEAQDPAPLFGRLVVDAIAALDPQDAVVVPDVSDTDLLADPWRAGELQDNPLLPLAVDHRSLLALLAGTRSEPPDPPAPLDAVAGIPGLLSAVVVARGGLIEACLEHLRRGGPRRLEVVVVDDAAPLVVTAWLAAQRDVVVVRNARSRGLAAARNQGLVRARGGQVLVLDDTTLLPRNWSEALVLGEGDAAVGPVAHGLRGSQHDATAVYGDLVQLQGVAADRRRRHRHGTTDASTLAGAPLLARRHDLLELGGYHEGLASELVDHDLAQRLASRGRLRVAGGVLAHVEAVAGRGCWPFGPASPLVTAALIVRDEQAALPACLASLRGVVDEVVVCDTGSSDATIQIAEAMGATVIRTPWDDDFAAARNTVLAAAHGIWVLSIDADEQLHVDDVLELRATLARSSDDALRLPVRSRSHREDPTGYEHHAPRLLRRGAVEWVGAVHEVPARIGTGGWVDTPPLPGVRLEHDGYLEDVRATRSKSERNLLLAEKDLARTPVGDARRWKSTYELARTLGVSERTASRVVALTRECLALDPPAHFRGGALVLLSGSLLALGDPVGAEAAARDALEVSPEVVTPTLALAAVLESRGRASEAVDVLRSWEPNGIDPAKEQLLTASLQRLTGADEARDPLAALEKWTELPQTTTTRVGRARCLLALGRLQESIEALDGIDVEQLRPDELLVVVTVAATAGDRDTAAGLLQQTGPLPPDLAGDAVELATLLGLLEALPTQVKEAATSA
jgi:glycosyltransferase involved in cell wall biosynthesis